MNVLVLDHTALIYYLIDLIVVLALLGVLRVFSGLLAEVPLDTVPSNRTNAAAGVSTAGTIVGIAIMAMGAVSGQAAPTPAAETVLMLGYGAVGLLLMGLTRLAFDRFSLPAINLKALIVSGNLAAGTVVAANLVATAIMVRAVMVWVDSTRLLGLLAVLTGYLASQLVLFLATRYRAAVYAQRHGGRRLHEAIEANNQALALRFGGHRIGAGLAVTAASGIARYTPDQFLLSLTVWIGAAIVLFVAQTAIAIAARHVLLPGVDVGTEVGKQANVAVGALEGAIYVAVGLIMVGLFG